MNYYNTNLLIKSTESTFNILKSFLSQKDITLTDHFFTFDKHLLKTYTMYSYQLYPAIKDIEAFDKDIFYYFLSKSLTSATLAIYISFFNNNIKEFNNFINSSLNIINKSEYKNTIEDFCNLLKETDIKIHDKKTIDEFFTFFNKNKNLSIVRLELKVKNIEYFNNNNNFKDTLGIMFLIGIIFSITIHKDILLSNKFILFNA